MMANPLADAMYDEDNKQGQSLSRQEQDHMSQVQPGEPCDCYLHTTIAKQIHIEPCGCQYATLEDGTTETKLCKMHQEMQ